VHFQKHGEIFLLPHNKIKAAKALMNSGGRKSISYNDFDRTLLVENKSGFPVHYLEAVNVLLKMAI
jgi:penicillin-binding protein-related factor A (putative recombinase)